MLGQSAPISIQRRGKVAPELAIVGARRAARATVSLEGNYPFVVPAASDFKIV
jgi:hypothetical protein